MINVLVVDDERDQNRIICSYLIRNGMHAVGCLSASEAYDAMYEMQFDIILSDIMMPGIDGFEFAKTVRLMDKNIPILFITAKDDLNSKSKGFSLEIDDYLVKPIELDELSMRIHALLRRAQIKESKEIKIGNFIMNSDEMEAYYQGKEIPLTVKEFNILFKMLSYPKKTFTREQLINEFWDFDSNTSNRTVDVYITKIRGKIADIQEFEIVTVMGLGYKAVLK